jgi:hypothetical protein
MIIVTIVGSVAGAGNLGVGLWILVAASRKANVAKSDVLLGALFTLVGAWLLTSILLL